MPEFVLSVDIGTTSTRAIVFNEAAEALCTSQLEYDQIYPHPGWHEQKHDDLIQSVYTALDGVAEKFKGMGYKLEDIKGVGLTNQRETACVWSRSTGKPFPNVNAIAWPDTRNTATIRQLAAKSDKGVDALKGKTGLPISTYFSGTKLRWMLDNIPAVKEAHDNDDLLFGTVESFALYNLTGGKDGGVHLTDVTNASRTMLMSLETLDWDKECLEFFGVKHNILPKIVSNAEVYGKISSGAFKGFQICGMIGDQQAALVGQKCVEVGSAKNTYGTGAFLLYNTGHNIVPSTHGLLTTPAYRAGPNAKPVYALEGSIAVAGSSVKWLRDSLNLIGDSADVGKLASQVKDTGGVYFVPAFSGLFAPYWDDSASGCIIGLTGYTTKHHLARATLESVCFQTKAILDAFAKDSKSELQILRVDGGLTNSDECMQIQSDILGISVERPDMRESTALGSALLAGVTLGLFGWDLTKPESLKKVNVAGKSTFTAKNDQKDRDQRYRGWNRAIERSKGWKTEEDERVAGAFEADQPKVAKG